MRCLLACFAAVGASALSTPASAAWNVAESKHFVIYANEKPADLSAFGAKLERFDQAGRYFMNMDDPPVGPGGRLTVFVLPSTSDIQKLAGNDFVKGFYKGPASGAVAFVPRDTEYHGPTSLTPDTIFFHEYTHHLTFQQLDRPLPQWFVEGFAEFMSTVRFEPDGSVGLGAPANHRAFSLFDGRRLPLETMLAGNYGHLPQDLHESIYARGWLLVHYLIFEPSRRGQLNRYGDLLAKGTPALDAARSAFGDLKQLDHDLNAYLNRSKIAYLKLAPGRFQTVPVTVRPLSEGAAKVILLRAELERGIKDDAAPKFAADVQAVEDRYAGDELVQLTLCQAELRAGQDEAATGAADRALKANPRDTKAIICKGAALAETAKKLSGPERHAAFGQARQLFIAANKIDTEDAEPLAMFFRTYVMEGLKPTDNAIAALHYASDLAPQDAPLRVSSAVAYLNQGKLKEARATLIPIAYNPHETELSQRAMAIIREIDAGDARGALTAGQAQAANSH
jgi:hypothetical protein